MIPVNIDLFLSFKSFVFKTQISIRTIHLQIHVNKVKSKA